MSDTRQVDGVNNPNPVHSPRILVADDHQMNRLVAIAQLARLGHVPDVVYNGEQALAAVIDGDYALVLMDCQMPDMDGFDATRHIRQYEARQGDARRIPIIAMTANAMPGDREQCLEAGMDDYITKPVMLEALRDALARWLPGITLLE
jgi:CheY-like chemotaxis protein